MTTDREIDWLAWAEREDERGDRAALHGMAWPAVQDTSPLPFERCQWHGPWAPLYFGDGDCPDCLHEQADYYARRNFNRLDPYNP